MRVNIKGNNPITSDQFKSVIDQLNEEYAKIGLTVKNMTCYVRFVDKNGRTVEPLNNGEKMVCEVFFESVKEVNK